MVWLAYAAFLVALGIFVDPKFEFKGVMSVLVVTTGVAACFYLTCLFVVRFAQIT